MSHADFASRHSFVLYAFFLCVASTGKAEFKGNVPSVNTRGIGFWISSILWFVLFFIMVSIILLMTGKTVMPL